MGFFDRKNSVKTTNNDYITNIDSSDSSKKTGTDDDYYSAGGNITFKDLDGEFADNIFGKAIGFAEKSIESSKVASESNQLNNLKTLQSLDDKKNDTNYTPVLFGVGAVLLIGYYITR